MGDRILFLLCVFTCLLRAHSVSLKGPVLTRYDPCGLGLIHFDRFSENYWRGIVHFGLYTNMIEAEMVILFKNEVTVAAVSIFFYFLSLRYRRSLKKGHNHSQ